MSPAFQHGRECQPDNRHEDAAGGFCPRSSLPACTMLFTEDDAPLLKKWIVKRLENTYVKNLPERFFW